MGLISCTYPEHGDPLGLAHEFKRTMTPIEVDVDETDVGSASIARLEAALDAAGQSKAEFTPLLSMKRNAQMYAPQFRIAVRVDGASVMEGAVNRRYLSFTWDDPIPPAVLTKVLQFAKAIPAADVEAEDDVGNPIDIASMAPACA
jgi:hypothetical protein